MERWRVAAVPLWSAVLAIAICAPLLSHGYVLSYDMVWVPQLDLHRREIWGLGSGLPRAVPSDAVVALLGAVIPAAVVQRLVLVGALFLLGLGVGRLLRERLLVAQLAGVTLAVWNPFVAERLVLGQWPLLIGLAGLPWLVDSLGGKDGPRWATATVALAATAMSPATGVMGLIVAIGAVWRNGALRVVLLAVLLNGPWIVAGLQHASIARSDPAAVRLFELQPEGYFGRLGSALSLGGIWNTEVVPTSRTLIIAALLAVVIGAVMILGLVTLWVDERRLLVVLAIPAVVGLGVALTGWLAPDLVARIVEDVPAGGLVRDGTRWLALLVPMEAVAFGSGAGAAFGRAELTRGKWPVVVCALMLPLVALPDLAWGVAGRLEPTTYPTSWASARRTITDASTRGDVLVLPFTSYRRPAWNHDTSVLDPAGRYFDRTTVVNDALEVSGRPIAGEDPRAARIGRVLERDDPANGLARRGIGIVVVETDVAGARRALRQLDGARELSVEGDGLRVFALDGARPTGVSDEDRKIMTLTWGAAGLTLLVALVGLVRAGVGRSHRQAPENRPRQVTKT